MARSERAGLQSLGENVGSGKAAPPPAVRKPVAFRQATEPEELNLKRSGRAEPFRTAGGAAAGEGSFHTGSEAPYPVPAGARALIRGQNFKTRGNRL